MNKENLMSLVLGLVVGLVVGFVFANNFNRSAGSAPPPANSVSGKPAADQDLPADHPPVGSKSEPENAAAVVPKVAAAIDKAKSEPQNFEAQMTAADLYYQIQRFDEATKFYEAATKLKPDQLEPMVKAGNAYFDAEKYEQARLWYERALQKDPKNPDLRADYGLTFFLGEPKDLDRAIREYSAALTIKPNHEIALQNLAIAYGEKNDQVNLNAALERLRKVNPNNPVLTKPADSK
jgi:tetratricopeptide (TPR) repeat protein